MGSAGLGSESRSAGSALLLTEQLGVPSSLRSLDRRIPMEPVDYIELGQLTSNHWLFSGI